MKNVFLICVAILLTYIVYLNFQIDGLKSNDQKLTSNLGESIESAELLDPLKTVSNENKKTEEPKQQIEKKDRVKPSDEEQNLVEVDLSNKKKFDEQLVNEEWAIEFSDKIFFLFLEHPELNDFKVQKIDCRETACKVDIFTNNEHAIPSAQKVANVLKSDVNIGNYQFYYDSEPEDGVIRFELDRIE